MVRINEFQQPVDPIRFQADLLASVCQSIVVVDLNRVVVYWNRAAEVMFGWTTLEAVGRKSVDLATRAETVEQQSQIAEAMMTGHNWSGEYEVTRRDGSRLSGRAVSLRDEAVR